MSLERRTFLVIVAAPIGLGPLFVGQSKSAKAQPQSTAPSPSAESAVKFNWRLPASDVGSVTKRLGLREQDAMPAPLDGTDRGGPALIIAGAAALSVLVRSLIDVYRELVYGGIIIKSSPNGLEIRNDPRLPSHVIVIQDNKGITIRELKDPIDSNKLSSQLAELSKRSRPPR